MDWKAATQREKPTMKMRFVFHPALPA